MQTSPEHLKFPIGRYEKPASISAAQLQVFINDIATLPGRLEAALAGLTEAQLDTPYRPDGWTVRQLVHHLADSHLNAHCRIRLALTEENPTIKPYDQDEWAKLNDVQKMPVSYSLGILRGLHARWAFLLNTLTEKELKRTFVHPEYGVTYSIEEMAGLYAHHGNNHLVQITGLKKRNGW